jgi:uncharacterized protein YecE (DUF72 family)
LKYTESVLNCGMDFGRLPSVDHIRFELPPEDPRTTAVLATPNTSTHRARVYVGGPIWTCPKWVGKVYPRGTSPRNYLSAYGRQFNSIELNSSFYHIPDRSQVVAWKSAVPGDFKFVPKLHSSISHFENFSEARTSLLSFWENIAYFEESLGLCFLQLPPHFDSRYWGAFKLLLRQVPDPKLIAVEFRHPSWFSGRRLHSEVFGFMQALGISSVITDVAGRRDVLHSSLTTRKVLVRFTGNELHPSDYERIDAWAQRAADWVERGIEELYFFVHQPTELEVPELTQRFTEQLNRRCGLSVRIWSPVSDLMSPQLDLF